MQIWVLLLIRMLTVYVLFVKMEPCLVKNIHLVAVADYVLKNTPGNTVSNLILYPCLKRCN